MVVMRSPAEVFDTAGGGESGVPVYLVRDGTALSALGLKAETQRWLEAQGFKPAARKMALLPDSAGAVSGVAFGLGNGTQGDPSGPSELLAGQLAQSLPAGTYRFHDPAFDARLAAIAWGLGAYKFRAYKSQSENALAKLSMSQGPDALSIASTVEAVWFGRDLINTPASDMGPAELEAAAKTLAQRHGASCSVVAGDDLLKENFPMIHAVGRASVRAPRLIDMRWGRPGARKITLIGKGICFDTGGLDIKPAAGMLLMKKDMGGAATALTLGHMIMSHELDVSLRILIPAAENSIAGNAFRPSDVLKSRSGRTVEIGNTDAEGRLVLADAMSLADEENPDTMIVFATLTGAARTALGPDLPALFTGDDALASALVSTGSAIGDPMWRLPLWPGYDRHLDSDVADMNNVWETPFAGAITAALFLKRFVKNARRFAHVDLYGWRTSPRPLGPKGGEPQTARAMFEVLREEVMA